MVCTKSAEGIRVNDEYNGMAHPASSTSPRYSRSAGVVSYRRRRRRNRITKTITTLFLLVIIGGAAFLLGRQVVGQTELPLGMPVNESESSEQASEAAPVMQPVEVGIIGTGDVIMNSAVIESGRTETGTYDFSHLFSHLKDEIKSFDVRMVSQETALAGSKFGFGYQNPLNAPQELGRSEIEAGFNVILRATDHTLDTGFEGLHNELSWWHSEFPNIPVLGVSEPDTNANPHLSDYVDNVYIFQKEGCTVAILNHSWGIEGEEQGAVSPLDEDRIKKDVQKARDAGVDLIVACPHWGEENNAEVHEEEREFTRVYAEQGVDVIIGTHPRVLQSAEVVENSQGHKTVCFYSLGCLISSLDGDSLIGGMAEVNVQRDSEGKCKVTSAKLKPTVTHRSSGEEYTTYMLKDYTDELASSSWDSGLTPEAISKTCKEVLGEAYNEDACELVLDLSKARKL